jgi:hypothetical protein
LHNHKLSKKPFLYWTHIKNNTNKSYFQNTFLSLIGAFLSLNENACHSTPSKKLNNSPVNPERKLKRGDHVSKKPEKISVPPRCGYCGEILGVVWENEYWTYSLNKNTGFSDGDLVDIEIRCPNCDRVLKDVFPEGVCNYSSGDD